MADSGVAHKNGIWESINPACKTSPYEAVDSGSGERKPPLSEMTGYEAGFLLGGSR
jgi:hypothetical protein